MDEASMAAPIYLIGMPGSGKSTLGADMACVLALPFVDLDARVAELAGAPIPQIFVEQGEPAFRALERRALADVAAEPGARAVATGGGVVLRADNVALMRASGVVLWIDRPLEAILGDLRADDTRPLLAGDTAERLQALHAQRAPLYRAAAHLRLENTGAREAVVAQALRLLAAKGISLPAGSGQRAFRSPFGNLRAPTNHSLGK
jgi:shikimate kinase